MLRQHQKSSRSCLGFAMASPQKLIGDIQAEPAISVGFLKDIRPDAGKNLGLQGGPSSKAMPNRRRQRENDREHGMGESRVLGHMIPSMIFQQLGHKTVDCSPDRSKALENIRGLLIFV